MLEALVDAVLRVSRGRTLRQAALALALGATVAGGLVAPPVSANGCPSLPFGGGSGTRADPLVLRDATDLRNLASSSSCWGYSYELGAAIDLSGGPWTPIGTTATPFTGTFDGSAFTVRGLSITGGASQQGLFGAVRGTASESADIRDLVLVDASVTGASQVGLLVGLAEFATISGITASGSVSGTSQVGGLVGQLGGTARGATLTESSASVTVTASGADAGGLVGVISAGSGVSASSASGSVSGTSQVGGLVGAAQGGITSSSASGSVTASGGSAGGLAGTSGSTITSSSANGGVNAGGAGAGGLVGVSAGSVTESSASGAVSAPGQSNVGGLVGSFDGIGGATTIARSFATGSVAGGANVGGLVGLLTQSDVVDAFASGPVTGASKVGGLIGFADVPSIGGVQRGYATGPTTASGSPVGGLIADGRPVTVSSSLWATDTTGQPSSPGGGSGRTIAQLREIATFTGWSIAEGPTSATTWGICPAVNGGSPFLQWAVSSSACAQSAGSLPAPVLQQFGARDDGTCDALAPSWLGPPAGGWSRSWARWPNGGRGGPVCTRTVVVDRATGAWVVAA